MRFAGRLSREEFEAVLDEQYGEILAAVADIVLYGPADWTGPRLLGSWGWANEVLDHAGLTFGLPDGPGPRVEVVVTPGQAEDWVRDKRVAAAYATSDDVEHAMLLAEVEAVRPDEVIIEVDGEARTFLRWPAPDSWYAAAGGVAVAAHGITHEEIRLVTVGDVTAYAKASKKYALARYDAAQR